MAGHSLMETVIWITTNKVTSTTLQCTLCKRFLVKRRIMHLRTIQILFPVTFVFFFRNGNHHSNEAHSSLFQNLIFRHIQIVEKSIRAVRAVVNDDYFNGTPTQVGYFSNIPRTCHFFLVRNIYRLEDYALILCFSHYFQINTLKSKKK